MRAVTRATRLLMTADAVGGVWTHALDLAGALATRRVETTLAVLGPAPSEAQRAQARRAGVGLVVLDAALDWLARGERDILQAGDAVARLAVECGADLVQLNSPALAIVDMPCPVLGVCHSCLATWWDAVRGGAMPPDFVWRSAMLARGYARCHARVAPSHAFAAATQRRYALSAAPHVVWNGRVDVPGSTATEAAGFAFTAGRLWDEGKDAATLDRAAARLDLPFLAAGPVRGPQGAGISLSHLRVLGEIGAAGIREWLARGPIFVSAARYEPFGLAVLEAAQAGCALVLSDIPTFRELWDGAALFVVPGDDAAFASRIAWLSRDGEQRSRLRVAALRRSRRFGVAAMADGMAAIHARLLAASPLRPEGSVAA
ncbi:glycosyltransferase family 4 protein [Roseomonas sp. AR75]|uniref:glycosyltransferase family 4 protein n=1 Tax=Roseomonas sp. AR75 TaxID=2562311 RepID=UPI001F10D8D5|nr:glycosyltransferase family 4 protein [Roseomonas sp. AR75]